MKAIVYAVLFIVLVFMCSSSYGQDVYVERNPKDCVNMYTLRLIVSASNSGRAFGEYDGVRYLATRRGTGPSDCRIEMRQADIRSGGPIVRNEFQCVFENPLGDN